MEWDYSSGLNALYRELITNLKIYTGENNNSTVNTSIDKKDR
jgi:hypothetical protein